MLFKRFALLFLIASMADVGEAVRTKGVSTSGQRYQQRNLRQLSKGSKGSKGGKGGKGGAKGGGVSSALSALISAPPTETCESECEEEAEEEVEDRSASTYNPFGTVTLQFNDDDSFLAHISATGLDPYCSKANPCDVAIYDGNSCDEPGEEYFDSIDFVENPWTADGSTNEYDTFTSNGRTLSAFTFDNGYDSMENSGKVIVLYGSGCTDIIACGVLEEKVMSNKLRVEMGPYPGYDGELEVSGDAYVIFNHDDTFEVMYNFKGLEMNVVDAGVHIHGGVSCDDFNDVLGHYWDDEVVDDLWTTEGGSTYSTDDKGKAKGSFFLYNGYGIEENVNHAFVIHSSTGVRVACGLLEYA